MIKFATVKAIFIKQGLLGIVFKPANRVTTRPTVILQNARQAATIILGFNREPL